MSRYRLSVQYGQDNRVGRTTLISEDGVRLEIPPEDLRMSFDNDGNTTPVIEIPVQIDEVPVSDKDVFSEVRNDESHHPLHRELPDYVGEILCMPEYGDAVVGMMTRFGQHNRVLIYDRRKVLEILVRDSGMTEEDAEDFFEFNIIGTWLGDATPAFVDLVKDWPWLADKHIGESVMTPGEAGYGILEALRKADVLKDDADSTTVCSIVTEEAIKIQQNALNAARSEVAGAELRIENALKDLVGDKADDENPWEMLDIAAGALRAMSKATGHRKGDESSDIRFLRYVGQLENKARKMEKERNAIHASLGQNTQDELSEAKERLH